MRNNKQIIITVVLITLAAFFIWFYINIISYILIAAILSILGHPLVKLFDKVKIRRLKIPRALSALLTLVLMWSVIFLIFSYLVPVIISQANMLSDLSIDTFNKAFQEPLLYVELWLRQHHLISPDDSIEQTVSARIYDMFNYVRFKDVINNIILFASNIVIAFFAISFITFFFLKDEHLFYRSLMVLTPDKYTDELKSILRQTKNLLTRYFAGLCLDLTLVISLITIGMYILGLKNALMIGFFAGIMNIVPYVGPFIGGTIGILLGLSGNLEMNFYAEMVPLIQKMVIVFVIVNLIDAIVLQPTIYSNSVKAHPLEIFLVILMAGALAGIPGMILAIPGYTVLRIIAKEFLSQLKVVKKLTENM